MCCIEVECGRVIYAVDRLIYIIGCLVAGFLTSYCSQFIAIRS